jgi:hypothetical protein
MFYFCVPTVKFYVHLLYIFLPAIFIFQISLTTDFIVCDVSGQNGNIMLELGIAAAWRRKEHVIILRDRSDYKPRLFDLNPARHLEYEISFAGTKKLMEDLSSVILSALANIPFSLEIKNLLPCHLAPLSMMVSM